MSSETHSQYYIEVQTDRGWSATGDAPMPFSAMDSPQTLDYDVWVAYLKYLQAREAYQEEGKRVNLRLSRMDTKTLRTVVHV